MSVDYRAGIAKGYIVTAEEMEKAAQAHNMCHADLTEILCDEEDMLIYLNTWTGGDYILGFDVHACDEFNQAGYIDDIDADAARSVRAMELYKQYFGNGVAPAPRLITFLSIT